MADMIPFTKMHGCGNDFVVIDAREAPVVLDEGALSAMADRRRGVGCDQIVIVEPARNGAADVYFRFHNADGSAAGACGNGTRCVAATLMAETGTDRIAIETVAGLLAATLRPDGLVAVDMGSAMLDWREIPLAEEMDTLHLDVTVGPLGDPVAVGMGNPHCVFFVADAEAIALDELGPRIETHALFPERTNVEVATVLAPDRIRLRVWERGAGLTQACGSGACAVLVASHRRDLTGRAAEIEVDGGVLGVEWRDDNHVVLTGPVATSFTGELDEEALA
ncbi:MAG: diaminopimelate epimerase [Alphaproteobacteria bacterium]|nr:diaminopimelate epimerase [Alphaproteobacteria bacterium]